MRFLIDECLHESLAKLAHAAGFEATHTHYLGLSGKPDRTIAARIVSEKDRALPRILSSRNTLNTLINLVKNPAPACYTRLCNRVFWA